MDGPQAMTDRVTFQGISRTEGDPFPFLHYSQRAGERILTGAVEVRDPALLRQLESGLTPGDQLEITTRTDWDEPALPVTFVSCTKLKIPAAA